MKNTKILFLSLLASILFFASCDDDDPVVKVDEAQILVEYLESVGGTPVYSFPAMVKSTDVNQAVLTSSTDMFVIDIRAAADYNAGHIEDAVNVPVTSTTNANDVLNYYEDNNLQTYETVALVCYSGQTAGWLNGLLRTMGYTNTKDMKWGMCSWNTATAGSWPGNISSTYTADLVTTASVKADEVSFPTLSTGKVLPTEILRDRVEAVLAEGFSEAAVTSSAVIDAPANYYIVNYWKQEDYDWGHIDGAIQYTPGTSSDLVSTAFLKTLPTDKTIAVYCYTGQTSAHVAAYLRVLGYDAKSIKFGVNGMAYNTMPGTKWADTEIHTYELVTD